VLNGKVVVIVILLVCALIALGMILRTWRTARADKLA
jgi:hypothetical protein